MAIADDSTGRYTESHAQTGRFVYRDVASDGGHTLVLVGELDVAAALELEASILGYDGSAELTLDLSRLTFMGSSGLRLILLARDVCKVRGTTFALIPGPAQVQRVFEVTDLLDRLPFQAT